MPPRLNKRQQRELEELEALGKASPEVNVSSEDEGANVLAPSTGGGFSAVSSIYQSHTFEEVHHESSSLQPQTRKKIRKVQMKGHLDPPRLGR
jgi:hypothetical protein